jgi:regulatory GntR family protein
LNLAVLKKNQLFLIKGVDLKDGMWYDYGIFNLFKLNFYSKESKSNMLSPITVELLYEKVKKQLLAYIDAEKPKILPCEKDLIKLFDVSRNTVRHAVQDLSRAGVLKPVQGCGTLVLKYTADKACDIGIICTDTLNVTDPWIASMISSLKLATHAEGYHLNLFFCHDYSINELNNSAYSYLVNSGKLAGLILLSALKYEDIAHIKNIGLPFVTVDLKYCDLIHPWVFFDYLDAAANVIDEYVNTGIRRFGITARTGEVLMGTKCKGLNEVIIENWAGVLQKKQLPVMNHDFSLDIIAQIKSMYALPADQRPQVVFSPFILSQNIEAILAEFADWNPIHIKSAMKGYETGEPCIVIDPAVHVRKAFTILHDMITNSQTVKEAAKHQVALV